MQLPEHPQGGVQIGISDILAWRDCALRMAAGMRRHQGAEAPESWSPQNAYGSAIHLCLSRLDEGATVEEAAQEAFAQFKQWLEPSDLSLLHEDMEKYLAREMLGVRTLLNEGEISLRLFEHPAVGQVWFRARIDRLFQSIEDPSQLVHLDYKSSKHAKSQDEVDKDPQLWAYNWSIDRWFRDLYPEVDDPKILQLYDQLRYGQIPTGKSDEQREEIERWLTTAITAIIEDADQLPTFNEWCPWCFLKMDCPVVQHELTDWALARIAALMPREPKLKKDGTPSKVLGPPKLDPERIDEYVELLPTVKRAAAVLKQFDETLTETLRQMPLSRLDRLGKRRVERSATVYTPEAKQAVIDEIGLARFLRVCDLSNSSVERYFASDKETVKRIKELAEKRPSYQIIVDA